MGIDLNFFRYKLDLNKEKDFFPEGKKRELERSRRAIKP
jgi:hypothetical protein